jgi:alpha-glucosidase
MKRLVLIVIVLLVLPGILVAQDITRLRKIGPVTSYTRTDKGLLLKCQDNSQVQLSVLAPDLVRVRVSFAKAIPTQDHSWAIAKESWQDVAWAAAETTNDITLSTSELKVVVHRSPLLIDFRDARSGNAERHGV